MGTKRQHLIDALERAFDLEQEMPRHFMEVQQWPDGAGVRAFIDQFLRTYVPFHPGNDGLHRVLDPNDVVESEVVIGTNEDAPMGAMWSKGPGQIIRWRLECEFCVVMKNRPW